MPKAPLRYLTCHPHELCPAGICFLHTLTEKSLDGRHQWLQSMVPSKSNWLTLHFTTASLHWEEEIAALSSHSCLSIQGGGAPEVHLCLVAQVDYDLTDACTKITLCRLSLLFNYRQSALDPRGWACRAISPGYWTRTLKSGFSSLLKDLPAGGQTRLPHWRGELLPAILGKPNPIWVLIFLHEEALRPE